jgi:hypothetical protein
MLPVTAKLSLPSSLITYTIIYKLNEHDFVGTFRKIIFRVLNFHDVRSVAGNLYGEQTEQFAEASELQQPLKPAVRPQSSSQAS